MKEQKIRGEENILEIEKIIINLQELGICLNEVVFRLPNSKAREYLLSEISKILKFKTSHDFCYLQDKISWMINMVMRYGLGGEVVELLEKIRVETEKIVQFDIRKIIGNLHWLGIRLKSTIFQLQGSPIKDYLLLETSKIIEFKTAHDFYYLHNKISRMIELVIKWELEGNILKLLEDVSVETKKIVLHIERDRSGLES